MRLCFPDFCRAEREYISEIVFGELLGFRFEVSWSQNQRGSIIQAEYNGVPDQKTLHLDDRFFELAREFWLRKESLPQSPLQEFLISDFSKSHEISRFKSIPLLYGNSRTLTSSTSDIKVDFDILGSSFFLLSRYEELVISDRDPHGRFPYSMSISCRENLIQRCLVNEYANLLGEIIKSLWPQVQPKPRKAFKVSVSCDVDRPSYFINRPILHVAEDFFRDLRSPLLLAKRWGAFLLQQRDPFDTFDWMMDEAENGGELITFNFIPKRTHKLDGKYDFERQSALIHHILTRGHFVGFHPSYMTHLDEDRWNLEFGLLKQKTSSLDSVRQHYLRLNIPETWQIQSRSGIHYDTSLGYAEAPGFRAGTSHSFFVYDLKQREKMSLQESPLIFMDASLKYLGIQDDQVSEALAIIQNLKSECRFHHGSFNVLWHNSNLETPLSRSTFQSAISKRD